jgi:predicted amidohydrolase
MWQIGYAWWNDFSEAREEYKVLATDTQGQFVGHFCELTRELGMAIVLTYLERTSAGPRNAATVIDRHGNPILTYAKVHTCDFSLEAELTPGAEFPVADLELAHDSVRIGLMICYDREFPESARALMLGGAEIILTPNACELDADRIGQFRARAFENMVGVAMANYAPSRPPKPLEPGDYNGHSVAFSGIVFGEHGQPLDHTLVAADESEGVFLASFDLDALRKYRKLQTWADAYRKPHAYQTLVVDAPAPVFKRKDSRRTP